MPKPIVLLDCDGPLADFTGAYLDLFFDVTGVRVTHEQVDRYGIHGCPFFLEAEKKMGWSEGTLKREIDRRVIAPGFTRGIKPHRKALLAVEEISALAEIYVVTSPWFSSPTWAHERTDWVRRHFDIAREHVIHAHRKHLIRGDIFVDDKPSHVREWAEHWPNGVAVLFDMPHNRLDSPVGTARAGWPFIVEHVENLSRRR